MGITYVRIGNHVPGFDFVNVWLQKEVFSQYISNHTLFQKLRLELFYAQIP